jgi:hypothetical protein
MLDISRIEWKGHCGKNVQNPWCWGTFRRKPTENPWNHPGHHGSLPLIWNNPLKNRGLVLDLFMNWGSQLLAKFSMIGASVLLEIIRDSLSVAMNTSACVLCSKQYGLWSPLIFRTVPWSEDKSLWIDWRPSPTDISHYFPLKIPFNPINTPIQSHSTCFWL